MLLRRRAFLGCLLPTIVAASQFRAKEEITAKPRCAERLKTVYEAIEAWRRRHADYPPDLDSLVKKGFLQNIQMLLCPEAEEQLSLSSVPDGVLTSTTYDKAATYEYDLAQDIPTNDRDAINLAEPNRRTWKMALMKTAVGDFVPILRCLRHLPVALNIPRTGVLYESDLYWEFKFVDLLPEVYAMPWMASTRSPSIHNFVSERPPALPAGALDLKEAANALSVDPWLDGVSSADSLCKASPVVNVRDAEGTVRAFDCRYLVQVCGGFGAYETWLARESFAGPSYPKQSKTVNIRCRNATQIFVLQATAYPAVPDSEVGKITLLFPDGTTQIQPLIYGRNTSVWRYKREKTPEPTPVWSGATGSAESPDWRASLFLLSFRVESSFQSDTPAELRLEANPDSRAGPFVAGINTSNN